MNRRRRDNPNNNNFFQGLGRNVQTAAENLWGRTRDGFGQFAAHNTDPAAPQQQQEHRPQTTPPASQRAIQQLPMVLVAPEDLVEESNRECCICFEA